MTQMAKVYGGSLFELATEENLNAEILQQCEEVSTILAQNPEYVRLLCQVNVPKKERTALLDEAFGEQVNVYLVNFMKILCEEGAMRDFTSCVKEYRRLYNVANGIMEAVAVSAVELNDAQTDALRKKLEEMTGKTIQLEVKVQADCLGGLRIILDGKELDGTVKARLAKLRRDLQSTVL